MIETEMDKESIPEFNLGSAIELAKKAHAEQISKSGLSLYIEHPLRIMEALKPYGQEVQIVGILHDTLEDTPLTEDELRQLGASEAVIEAVAALTKVEDESYDDLIKRAKANPLAKMVKLVDNLDNSNEDRLARLKPDHAEYARRKFASARVILLEGDPWLAEQVPVLQQRVAVLYRRDKKI